jgi:hypothetical protein
MKHSSTLRATVACAALGSIAWIGLAVADDAPSAAGGQLPTEVRAAASAFSAYMEQAAGVNSQFSGGESVAQALKIGASYEPSEFQEGMIGFGAMAALQDGRFVRGIEAAASRAGDRQALAQRIAADPGVVLQFDGAAEAAGRVQAALHARGASLFGAGGHVKQAAYAIQHKPWSTVTVADGAARLSELKALSSSRRSPSDSDNARLLQTVAGPTLPAGEAVQVTVVVMHALALAAEADLGAARDGDLPRLQPLLAERSTTDCLRIAKLNLYQCMAVAGPQYEDVFCLGHYELMDTGQCVTRAVGEPAPAVDLASPVPAANPQAERQTLASAAN